MTYTPIQLDIIQVFGRKELSKWLIILKERISEIIAIDYEREWFYRMIDDWENTFSWSIKWAEILWHIPHLEDVFRVAEEKLWDDYEIRISNKSIYFFSRSKWAFEYPYKRWTPLIEQPESVLIQLLNLFK